MKEKLRKKAAIVGFILITFITTTASAFTAVTSGNWSSATTWGGVAPGATVNSQDINIPSGITVNLDMDVTFSGLINSFTVNGTLNNSSAYAVTMNQGAFAGTGTVNINRLVFTSILSTMSYTGTMTVNRFQNSGAALTIAAVMSISDTLNLDAGSIVLNSGANLAMMTNSTVRVNNGTITIGGGIFNSSSSYNVMYVGSSKTTGIEINTTTLKDLRLQMTDNSQTLILGGNLAVNGTTYMTLGKMDFSGRQITLNGDLLVASGSTFTSNATSNMIIGGSTSLTNGLSFTSGSSMNDLTINHTGSGNVKLLTNLSIAGDLNLMNNSFSLESGSTLTMNAASTAKIQSGTLVLNGGTFNGTAAYNVEYMGGNIMTGTELTGSGLNDLTVNLSSPYDSVQMANSVIVSGALAMQNGQLRLRGNKLTVNGSFDQNSTAFFVGSNSSELEFNTGSSINDTLYFNSSAGNNTLSKLTLNTGSGTTTYLGSSLIIVNQLNLVSGKLDIRNDNLIIRSTGSITGYSSSNYVVTSGSGSLQMRVNSASAYVTFPVGTTSGYSPASVQQTASGSSGDFMVSTMPGVYSAGTTGWNSAMYGSVVNRTWMVSAASGVSVNTNLKLGWYAADEVNGFDRTNAYISHYTSSAWDNYSFATATTGSGSIYEMQRMSITSLSPFAVVDSMASLVLGIEENTSLSINVYPNPATDKVNIENPNINDTYMYELIDVTGKTITSASNKNSMNTFDLSNLSMGCYFVKATNLTSKKVIAKRVIKS